MELEIRLKITTQTRDDSTSTADLRIAKDNCGFIFLTKETETAFLLTAHLKGYRRHNIDIAINEDGSQMVICGSRPVREKVMRGWIMHEKEVEINEFQKVFKIPRGVVLDKIKAKFEEDKSTLVILMPKSVKGLSGQKIEEMKETREGDRDRGEQDMERERTRSDLEKHKTTDKSEEKNHLRQGEMSEFPPASICLEGEFQGSKSKSRHQTLGGDIHGNESIQLPGIANSQSLHPEPHDVDKSHDKGQHCETTENASPDQIPQHVGDYTNNAKPSRKRWNKCKICDPAIAGSALLVSLLIIVTQLIRTKRK